MILSCRAANAAPAGRWCWVTFREQSRVISRERRRIRLDCAFGIAAPLPEKRRSPNMRCASVGRRTCPCSPHVGPWFRPGPIFPAIDPPLSHSVYRCCPNRIRDHPETGSEHPATATLALATAVLLGAPAASLASLVPRTRSRNSSRSSPSPVGRGYRRHREAARPRPDPASGAQGRARFALRRVCFSPPLPFPSKVLAHSADYPTSRAGGSETDRRGTAPIATTT